MKNWQTGGGPEDRELFDSIIFADEQFRVEGYQEGFERGKCRGFREGHRHGASHGARLSAEISFYYGFCVTWKCLLQNGTDAKSRKRLKTLESVLGFIQNHPGDDRLLLSATLQEDVEKLRAKFRQVCAMLNVPADFRDYMRTTEGTSF